MCKYSGQYRPRLEKLQVVTELETHMAGPARRDLVWDAALRALVSNPASIRLHDVQVYIDEAEVSDRTVRRTMNAMQALGWLEKDKQSGHFWYPGPKARQFLRVPSAEQNDDHAAVEDVQEEIKRNVIDEVVARVDVRATGATLDRRRRDLLHAILEYIREVGEVSPAEVQGKFYPDSENESVERDEAADAVGYGSVDSWWKNFVYKCLSDIDIVETGGEGSRTWFYVGEE